ncbi:MAG TPA: N-acetylmuramic acid 6-phosphate etherase [Gammaproteobacteria bacterium]|jgi:N-acetylmuramic acid 6-phosphate etherase|nr:N-acetylmuramic acid 6-phosphate etherase [Gammaproteobacteria bacterium]
MLTEKANSNTLHLHKMSALEIVEIMNVEDATVTDSVREVLTEIAAAVELIAERLEKGGRLFYVGAGTSGRLGVLDASECPPTFGTLPEMVQGIMAGGETAMSDAVEGAEDDRSAGEASMLKNKVDNRDVVVAIAASGTTPFVLAAVEFAREQGAATVGLACNSPSPLLDNVDVSIGVPVGPEVLAGSTRLKAGTAQKMVLNMLSTATMVRLGKVYQNRMVDVQTTNKKLIRRAIEMVSELGEVSTEIATELLQESGNHVKTAVVMAKLGINSDGAKKLLDGNNGNLSKVL